MSDFAVEIERLILERDEARKNAEWRLARANLEISRRERAEIAYTQSEQKRLILIDRAEKAESQLTILRGALETLIAKWRTEVKARREQDKDGLDPGFGYATICCLDSCADELSAAIAVSPP
jgi:hypothetical protein